MTSPRDPAEETDLHPGDPLDSTAPMRPQRTEPNLNATDPMDVPRAPRKQDTMPDGQAEMRSLLDGLLPKDGRAVPPRAIAETSASSSGKDFVAYSGEARPVMGRETPEPVDAVIVMKELADLARATKTEPPLAEERSAALEETHPRPKSGGSLTLVAIGITIGLLVVGVVFLLRGHPENHGAAVPVTTTTGAVASPVIPPAPAAPATAVPAKAPTVPTSSPSSAATIPSPTAAALAPSSTSVRSQGRPASSARVKPSSSVDPSNPQLFMVP